MVVNNPYKISPTSKVTPPLSRQSTKLKYQFELYVPSTDYEKPVKEKIYQKRVDDTRLFLAETYGGDTTIKGSGGYVFQGKGKNKKKLVKEKVTIVETSMDKKQYEKNKPKLEKFIESKKKEWHQESIGYKFEDDFYIYPKFD